MVLPGSSDRPVVVRALRSFTLHSAYATFDEDKKGSVEVGKLADLTVLHQGLTTIDPTGIDKTQVMSTMVRRDLRIRPDLAQ